MWRRIKMRLRDVERGFGPRLRKKIGLECLLAFRSPEKTIGQHPLRIRDFCSPDVTGRK